MEFSFSQLLGCIKKVLLTPTAFWEEQKESGDSKKLWLTYLLPIALVVAVAVFVGEFFKRTDFFIQFPLVKAVGKVVLFLLQYLVGVFFTSALMKTYKAEKNVNIARKLVVYSMTPILLVSLITGLFPSLYIVSIVGMYSFYLFWIGAKSLVSIPNNKENSYILITILVNLFMYSFLNVFLSNILIAFY